MNVNDAVIASAQDLVDFIRHVAQNEGIDGVLEETKTKLAEAAKLTEEWQKARDEAEAQRTANEDFEKSLLEREEAIDLRAEKLEAEMQTFRQTQIDWREDAGEKTDRIKEREKAVSLRETEVNDRLGKAQKLEVALDEREAAIEEGEIALQGRLEKLKTI